MWKMAEHGKVYLYVYDFVAGAKLGSNGTVFYMSGVCTRHSTDRLPITFTSTLGRARRPVQAAESDLPD
jgi:hypothetical protein